MENKLVGLTGGIGSGKSTALRILKDFGFNTLSCDEICYDLYKKRKVKEIIKASFPHAVKGEKKLYIDKKELSKCLENDGDYEKLTSITTPLIINEALKRAKKLGGTVILETPILFESKVEDLFDKIIVVLRNKMTRIDDTIKRSNLSEEEVLTRINRQIDYDNFDFSPHIVVENNSDKKALEVALKKVVKENL